MHEDVGIIGEDVTEENLALQLKELCFVNGRERDPKNSAVIFHKLALLYMNKCPDKISLIQSAALFNAAIIREPDNVIEVKKDLERLCSLILKTAGITKADVDLVSAAKTCQKAIIQFRDDTNEELAKLSSIPDDAEEGKLHKFQKRKIEEMRNLQNNITENYLSIMSFLSDFCLSIMGEPPSHCRFALVGMGSLARREITPYSDFENVIVLEEGSQLKDNYCEIIEYFRWFAVLFQIILINIGETIVPSIAIPSLNDFTKPNGDWFFDAYTPSGISFDGLMPYACKMPLGRQHSTRKKSWTTELIKPSSAMAKYLDWDENLKNGYHLADVLSRTCFVSGDRRVYEDFAARTVKKLTLHRKTKTKFVNDVKKQILDDKLKFDVNANCSFMYSTSRLNLKKVIYRSITVFVSALGTLYGIEKASCFDVIEGLLELKVLTDIESHYLKYAVATACEVRLKIYMRRQRQSDLVENRTLGRELSEILDVVGGRCIVDYFTIARSFQNALTSFNFYDFAKLKLNMNLDYKYSIDICCKLRLNKICVQVCTAMLQNDKLDLNTEDEASCHYYSGISLLDLDNPRDALIHFTKELQIRQKLHKGAKKLFVADSYYNIGRCHVAMARYTVALEYFEQELDIRRQLADDGETTDTDIAFCNREMGGCLLSLNRMEQAIEKFRLALDIWKRGSPDASTDIHIVHCIFQIGVCWMKTKTFDLALKEFQEELDRRKRLSTDEDTDIYVAECLKRIGTCLMNMEKYREAIEKFERALTIFQRFHETKSRNEKIALCIYNVRLCNEMLGLSEASTTFQTDAKNDVLSDFDHECVSDQPSASGKHPASL